MIDTNRIPEAAFFARTYLPSQITRVVGLWRDELQKTNAKAAQALADPISYENLFTDFQATLKAEQFLKPERSNILPANEYSEIVVS